MPCWYCGVRLKAGTSPKARASPNLRTKEHLVSLANGGTCNRRNLRYACAKCNSFVGDWRVETKLRFRLLIRQCKGWCGLLRRYPIKAARRSKIERDLAQWGEPSGRVAADARKLAERYEVPSKSQGSKGETSKAGPGDVEVGVSDYLAATGSMPRGRDRAVWRFRIGDGAWQAPKGCGFASACDLARRRAHATGESRIFVVP